MTRARPAFVTLTGADHPELIPALRDLSADFAHRVEFGILIAPEKVGTSRFPDASTLATLRQSGLRLSAHICGTLADRVFAGNAPDVDLSGFCRAQINLVGRHAAPPEIEAAIAFGRRRGIRTILQCGVDYPGDARCDWLVDSSFGQGRPLAQDPDPATTAAFCGISGGLDAQNVGALLDRLSRRAVPPFWLDAETALRDTNGFSPDRCHAFLSQIYLS